MSFPPTDLCLTLPAIPTLDKICLPGGVCLDYIWDSIGKIPTAADVSLDFFSQIGPAMTPLLPFFNMLDTVVSLFNCVKAIPEAIFKLDPSELIECVPALAQAVDQLLKLIPQLSLPKMIIAIVRNMALLLESIAGDVRYLQSQLARCAAMIDRAADLNDHVLNGFIVCAQADIRGTMSATAEALRGIGSIVLILNILLGLFGGPEIPCFGDLLDDLDVGFDSIVTLLTGLAALLRDIANAIPDPDFALTRLLADQRC
jgi:hypothetical protein